MLENVDTAKVYFENSAVSALKKLLPKLDDIIKYGMGDIPEEEKEEATKNYDDGIVYLMEHQKELKSIVEECDKDERAGCEKAMFQFVGPRSLASLVPGFVHVWVDKAQAPASEAPSVQEMRDGFKSVKKAINKLQESIQENEEDAKVVADALVTIRNRKRNMSSGGDGSSGKHRH